MEYIVKENMENEILSSKPEDTKQKILRAAREEFSEYGFHGARVDRIAELAGINKRMLYAYFGNKEDLYKKILLDVYRSLGVREEALMEKDRNESPDKAIANVIDLYFDFLTNNEKFVRMLMWENLNYARCLAETGEQNIKKSMIDYVELKIAQGKQMGIFREDVLADRVTTALLTFVFSYFSNRHTLSMTLGRNLADIKEINVHRSFVHKLIEGYLKDADNI